MILDYFLKRKGFWSRRFFSRSIFFNFFLKPLVFLDVLFLEKSQYWSEEKIKKIQWERIEHLLEVAWQYAHFWHQHFEKAGISPSNIITWADFEKIPIIKKDDLRGKPLEFVICTNVPKYQLFKDDTSGSTGVPFKFLVDRNFVLRGLAFCQRMFRMVGQKSGDTFVRFSPTDRPGLNFGNYFFKVATYDEFEKRVDDFIELYNNKSLVIYGVTSYLVELAKQLARKNHQIIFRAAIASGEALSDIQKKFIENHLKCPISRCYTTREQGWIAQECLNGGFHINTEWCYLEVVDDNGRPVPKGKEGRIVITTFDNEVMPFIRYDTGDIGEILIEKCSCGRTLPLIKFHGRKTGILQLPGGRTMHHIVLTCSFHERADRIKKFQIIQETVDKVLIKIIPENNFMPIDLTTIKEELYSTLGKEVNLAIEMVDYIPSGPRGKGAAFISNIKKDA